MDLIKYPERKKETTDKIPGQCRRGYQPTKYDLNKDFPDQKGWLAMCSPKERIDFIEGGLLYDTETGDDKRVFTLRAARKYTLDGLYNIQNYMIMSDRIDIFNNDKHKISFDNVLKAIQENYPPPTKADREETERSLMRFKKAHPEFFGVIDDEA